jgi:hypothetical protein
MEKSFSPFQFVDASLRGGLSMELAQACERGLAEPTGWEMRAVIVGAVAADGLPDRLVWWPSRSGLQDRCGVLRPPTEWRLRLARCNRLHLAARLLYRLCFKPRVRQRESIAAFDEVADELAQMEDEVTPRQRSA